MALVLGLALAVLSAGHCASAAARPPAARLFPDDTCIFAAVPSVPDLKTKFMNSSTGRMAQDPQVAPLLAHFYGGVLEAAAEVKRQTGLGLDEIMSIPQGEIAFGLAPPVEDAREPSLLFLIDGGSESGKLHTLIELARKEADSRGGKRSEEAVGGTTVVSYELRDGRERAAYFEREGVVVFGNNPAAVRHVLSAWNGEKVKSLAENQKFAAAMERCRNPGGEEPNLLFFIDPIALFKAGARGNTGMQIALAMLPTLGLDGFGGIGASMTFDAGQLDSIMHAHVLLDNPRTGVFDVLALESGDTNPETWVPNDVQMYMTFHWQFERSLKNLARLIDSFQSEGTFERELKRRFERTGTDPGKDILPHLEGRVTIATRIEHPATINSRSFLIAAKLKDTEAVAKALESVFTTNEQALEKKSFADKQYYHVKPQGPETDPNVPRRRPDFSFGILGDYLVFADRPSLYEKAVATLQTPDESLAKSLDYKIVVGRAKRLAGNAKLGAIIFDRPDESLRFVYDLVAGESGRNFIRQQGEREGPFKLLNSTLEANPLPPFAVLERYLAPTGAVITDDETGIHFIAFGLKRK
jgi:hypothetical protein